MGKIRGVVPLLSWTVGASTFSKINAVHSKTGIVEKLREFSVEEVVRHAVNPQQRWAGSKRLVRVIVWVVAHNRCHNICFIIRVVAELDGEVLVALSQEVWFPLLHLIHMYNDRSIVGVVCASRLKCSRGETSAILLMFANFTFTNFANWGRG